jgi:signal transduction histidine kinase
VCYFQHTTYSLLSCRAMTTRSLLRAAGLLVWVFVGVPIAIRSVNEGWSLAALLPWLSAFGVFGWAFLRATSAAPVASVMRILTVQTLAALTMNTLLCTGFEVALLVVVAVELGWMLPLRTAVVWLFTQTVLATALAVFHMGTYRGGWWSAAFAFASTFAFVVAAMAGREAAARRILERTNAELEATRDELARASRDAERLRIARELHDLLGHDLVALHLELEVARHLADERTREHIERATEVARGLLADVRAAVGRLREGPTDVSAELRALVAKVSRPCAHLDLPTGLHRIDAESANALVRCVQEIVTNAMKHASAENVWIAITRADGGLEVAAHDDGRGGEAVAPGNGLGGMRERIEKLGGTLDLEMRPGAGFHVRAVIPYAEVP